LEQCVYKTDCGGHENVKEARRDPRHTPLKALRGSMALSIP
jgi:hypothetical protein